MSRLPTDGEIMDVIVVRSGSILPTYYLKNILRAKFKDVTTPWLRQRLKVMEKAGKVRRASSDYAVMICWDLAKQNEAASNENSQRGSEA